MAGNARSRPIVACDGGADGRTADRLEEVLDEVVLQQALLRDLLRRAAPGGGGRALGPGR